MATIKDLNIKSIIDDSPDEAIERLRQIRLSRRTPKKKVTTKKKATSKSTAKVAIKGLSKDAIADLLSTIGETK